MKCPFKFTQRFTTVSETASYSGMKKTYQVVEDNCDCDPQCALLVEKFGKCYCGLIVTHPSEILNFEKLGDRPYGAI